MKASPTALNATLFNSFVLGIHNYFNRATHVSVAFSRLAYDLRAFMYNRLKQVGKYEHPANPPPTYSKFYSLGFSKGLSLYTTAGREQIHKKLRPDLRQEIYHLMNSSVPNQSVEYMDNRLSRYSMKMGKCEITGMYLFATDVHCHHFTPLHLGGSDKFNNLRILHKEVQQLIHQTHKETIDVLMNRLGITDLMKIKINQYREKYGLEPV